MATDIKACGASPGPADDGEPDEDRETKTSARTEVRAYADLGSAGGRLEQLLTGRRPRCRRVMTVPGDPSSKRGSVAYLTTQAATRDVPGVEAEAPAGIEAGRFSADDRHALGESIVSPAASSQLTPKKGGRRISTITDRTSLGDGTGGDKDRGFGAPETGLVQDVHPADDSLSSPAAPPRSRRQLAAYPGTG